MKQIFTILLFFGLITNSFSQELNNQQIENDLYSSYQKIVSLKSTEFGDDFDLLAIVNNKFTDKIKKYTSTFPKMLTAKFDSLRKHPNIYIVDSKDKQMRIYSWNTLMGGSRPYFANIFQYKVDSKVFSKVAYNQPYTLDGDYNDKNFQNFPFYSQIFTLEANNKTYYLGISNKIHSGQEVSQSIKIFTFDENKLNDSVALIKTQNGFVNTIDFNFNFFNLSDRPERPFQLIKYDSVKKIISIPTLDNNDNLSENFILYKFTGQHFELLETPKNKKTNEIGIGFVTHKPLFVNAENGLIIRASPNKKAQRIGKFEYAQEIKLYRKTGKYIEIIDDGKNISGEWYEVSGFNLNEPNQIGYVFSGLLTAEILKKKINDSDSIQTITTSKISESKGVDISKNNLESTKETLNINTIIGEGKIARSKIEGNNNWSEIVATNIFGFKKNVGIGEIVQLIPLRKDIPIIKLEVISTEKRDDGDIWYEIELETISENYKEYWSIKSLPCKSENYPSDVLIVYPPIKNCTLLQGIQFESKDLPENISNDLIKGALDFDGDNLPDALVCEFCCKKGGPTGGTCEYTCKYTCGETYIKENNKWIMINSSEPM
jgi:hypothetical protein